MAKKNSMSGLDSINKGVSDLEKLIMSSSNSNSDSNFDSNSESNSESFSAITDNSNTLENSNSNQPDTFNNDISFYFEKVTNKDKYESANISQRHRNILRFAATINDSNISSLLYNILEDFIINFGLDEIYNKTQKMYNRKTK